MQKAVCYIILLKVFLHARMDGFAGGKVQDEIRKKAC